MVDGDNPMGNQEIFQGDYEFRMFCGLPQRLKERVITIEGNNISIENINPLSLVCVQMSGNPGTTPFIIQEGKTTFDLFKILAKERGFNIGDFHNSLIEKSGITSPIS